MIEESIKETSQAFTDLTKEIKELVIELKLYHSIIQQERKTLNTWTMADKDEETKPEKKKKSNVLVTPEDFEELKEEIREEVSILEEKEKKEVKKVPKKVEVTTEMLMELAQKIVAKDGNHDRARNILKYIDCDKIRNIPIDKFDYVYEKFKEIVNE